MNSSFNTIVIGGGLVGAAIASGLAARDPSILVVDGDDRDFRASRGNFGLIWVQGKGADFAPYARWSAMAARAWPDLVADLQEATGVDIGYQQTGGYDFCLTPQDWDARAQEMRQVQTHTGGDFVYQMLENSELRQRIPEVSSEVLGASYSPQDGHANPLYLLRALHQQMQNLGCQYVSGQPVVSIRHQQDHFVVDCETSRYRCERVLLCAGLGNKRLAQELGMNIPLEPLRGQLLISERVAPFLPCATLQVRQTREGTLQIGDSHESVGFDESTTLDVITRLAARAVRIFPHLSSVHLNRAWGALRVMTPDGLPVYHQSDDFPGAFAVSCHSGVTLAALHTSEIANWIYGDKPHDLITHFSAARFDVSTN